MQINSKYSWQGEFCLENTSRANTIIIFGASGDLTARKLIPALHKLHLRGLLNEKTIIIGCARTTMSDLLFRDKLKSWIEKYNSEKIDEEFFKKVFYFSLDYYKNEEYNKLANYIDKCEEKQNITPQSNERIFYFATPPNLYQQIAYALGTEKLLKEKDSEDALARRVILEKPFGINSKSAVDLDKKLHKVLKEKQIYRIDHYLGKETVQNILILRFANSIFEPIWNSKYIDNIQITIAETVGVEHRAKYFDKAGLLRDMFQNHILEILSLIAMEVPPEADAESIRNEKIKLLKSIRPFSEEKIEKLVVFGQYENYHSEEGIPENSKTETFVATKLYIDNWRWRGVPFFIRSGKKMKEKRSQIVINFKPIAHSIFRPLRSEDLEANRLIIDVQPQEGIALSIQVKQPGPKLCMGALSMNFKYESILNENKSMPDAYERLLLDCMAGDQTLFIRNDTIKYAWELLEPLLNSANKRNVIEYKENSWGPKEADILIQNDGIFWYCSNNQNNQEEK